MKRLVCLLLLLIPINYYSLTLETRNILDCPKDNLHVNETIQCDVIVDSNSGGIYGFTSDFEYDGKIAKVEFTPAKHFTGTYKNNKIGVYADTILFNKVVVGKIKITSSTEGIGTLDFKNIVITDENYKDYKIEEYKYTIRVTEKIARIDNITFSNGIIDRKFESSTFNYIINTDQSSITFSSTSKGNITGLQKYDLNYGNNNIVISIRSEDGNITSYTFNVIRKDNRDGNNEILDVSLSAGTFEFRKDTHEYYIDLEGYIDKVLVNAHALSDKATVTYSPNNIVELHKGVTTNLFVIITAENGNQNVYTFKLHRSEILNNNNYLKELSVENFDINFNKDNSFYTVVVPENVDKIKINAVPEYLGATIKGDGEYPLVNGANNIVINVTSDSGNVRKYAIKVLKNIEPITLSNNCSLSRMIVNDKEITFDENNNYYIDVNSEAEFLKLEYFPQDDNELIIVNGNNSFVSGENKVVLTVIAESGKYETYNIIVNKSYSISSSNITYRTLVMILLLVIMACFLVIIFTKNKILKKNLSKNK